MKNNWTLLIGGLGLGVGAMYLLDPNQGRRRRAYLRDQAVHTGHAVSDAADTAARDLRNRAAGAAAEARSRFRREEVWDEVLVERVRAAMGRAVSHPHAIHATAAAGRVTLSGPVLALEAGRLLAAVARVRGVKGLEDRLERHEEPGDVPALQGHRTARHGLGRANWPPATRLVAGAAGGALAIYGAVRRDAAGAALGVAGLGLLARAAANLKQGRVLNAALLALGSPDGDTQTVPREEWGHFLDRFSGFNQETTIRLEIVGSEDAGTQVLAENRPLLAVTLDEEAGPAQVIIECGDTVGGSPVAFRHVVQHPAAIRARKKDLVGWDALEIETRGGEGTVVLTVNPHPERGNPGLEEVGHSETRL